MNIRILFPVVFSFAICSTAFSGDARARLLNKDGSHSDVLIIDYKGGSVLHRSSAKDLNKVKTKVSSLDGVYFYVPSVYTEATYLYEERKFKEAKKMFAQCEADFKSVDTAKGNYATLAGFYKLECSRRMFDFKALSSEQEKFRNKALTRESHIVQLELNALWEAFGLQDWERLESLTQKWSEKNVTNSQLAQIAYCRAVALDEIAIKDPTRMEEALDAYDKAIVLDQVGSLELVTAATEKILDIYVNDKAVKIAMKLWETKDEETNSDGYVKLVRANALVRTYQLGGFSHIKPLSAEHAGLIKFKPKDKS